MDRVDHGGKRGASGQGRGGPRGAGKSPAPVKAAQAGGTGPTGPNQHPSQPNSGPIGPNEHILKTAGTKKRGGRKAGARTPSEAAPSETASQETASDTDGGIEAVQHAAPAPGGDPTIGTPKEESDSAPGVEGTAHESPATKTKGSAHRRAN